MPLKHPFNHKIEIIIGKTIPYKKNKPFSVKKLKIIRKWVIDNLSKGFIRTMTIPNVVPLLLTRKSEKDIRIYYNYKRLNDIIIKNRYPLPLIRETLNAFVSVK